MMHHVFIWSYDFPGCPDDTISLTLPYTECGREDAADVEPTTSSGGLSGLQSSDVSQEFEYDSSPDSDPQVDSDIEDLPEDDPLGQIDTAMDSALVSGGTTTRAEALLMFGAFLAVLENTRMLYLWKVLLRRGQGNNTIWGLICAISGETNFLFRACIKSTHLSSLLNHAHAESPLQACTFFFERGPAHVCGQPAVAVLDLVLSARCLLESCSLEVECCSHKSSWLSTVGGEDKELH
nr:uncharacterized protein LOC129160660 isoform X3 [Nothobranchius furzeri]